MVRGLVLGGGGIAGIAWEIGVLAGLAERGVDVTGAERIVGTSAGSVVGALVAGGTALEALYAEQLADPAGEIPAALGAWAVARLAFAALCPGDDRAMLRRIGGMALSATTPPAEERRAVIARRLGGADWPDRDLRVTAVDAETGEFTVFRAGGRATLVDAVAASCAVPFVWAPAPIDGRRYYDGGMRSPVNADLADGCDPVVVLAPLRRALRPTARLSTQIAALGPEVRVAVVTPDDAARAAMGPNLLDPKCRAASARAGRAQADSVVAEVAAVWQSVDSSRLALAHPRQVIRMAQHAVSATC
jgi:NTE family protein